MTWNENNVSEPHHTSLRRQCASHLGSVADFTIVDLKRRETIQASWIASLSRWTPYDGLRVTGWPVGTIIRGRRVMWEGELAAPSVGEAARFAG